jgi:hypothetical protein
MSSSYIFLPKEKIKELLINEIKKIEHEIAISELVYSLHGEDTFEDLFRDNIPLLEEKIKGIKFALKTLEEDYDCETSSEK